MRITFPILALSFPMLAGCATNAIHCPPLVEYSLLEQSVLADELPKDGKQSQIVIEDYAQLRSACRKR